MKKFLLLTAIVSVASVAAIAPAMAKPPRGGDGDGGSSTATGTITVNASTKAKCLAPAAITAQLGNYDGTAPATNSGNISFKCTNGTNATVALRSASTNGSDNGLLSANNGTPIKYSFTGNGSTGVGSGLGSTAGFISTEYTITVPADQNPIPAAYTDTINVSVNY